MMKMFGWLVISTPEKRARREITGINRQIYDMEKDLEMAKAALAYLTKRRDFLAARYGIEAPPPR
jgi:hypothetical protein